MWSGKFLALNENQGVSLTRRTITLLFVPHEPEMKQITYESLSSVWSKEKSMLRSWSVIKIGTGDLEVIINRSFTTSIIGQFLDVETLVITTHRCAIGETLSIQEIGCPSGLRSGPLKSITRDIQN